MSSQTPFRPQDPSSKVSKHRWASGSTHLPNNGTSNAPCSPQSSLPRRTPTLPPPQPHRPGPSRGGQPASAAQSSSSTPSTVEPARQSPQITEVSVAAVMRLAGRLRDLDGVMGLWDDFERECNGKPLPEPLNSEVHHSQLQIRLTG
jgi:hypothetical protein